MTVYAITDTKKGRTGIAPTYLQTTRLVLCLHRTSGMHDVFGSARGSVRSVTKCVKLLLWVCPFRLA